MMNLFLKLNLIIFVYWINDIVTNVQIISFSFVLENLNPLLKQNLITCF